MNLELNEEERDIVGRAVRCYEVHLTRIGAQGNDGSEDFLIDALDYYANFLGEQFGPAGVELHEEIETPELNRTMSEIDRCSALSIRLGLESTSESSYWDH